MINNTYETEGMTDDYQSFQAQEKTIDLEYFPLSSAQKRMFILNELDKLSTTYNILIVEDLGLDVDVKLFEDTFLKLIARHESLRTSFVLIDEEPVQRIHNEVDFSVGYKECIYDTIDKITDDFVQPFDLQKAPLFRAQVAKVASNRYLLMLDFHHIISDAISIEIIRSDFKQLLMGERLEKPKVQYKDFALWQVSNNGSGEYQRHEEYWLKRLGGELPMLNMPTDFPKDASYDFEGANISFALPQELVLKIRQLSKTAQCTPYVLFLAMYNVLLQKYTGQQDVIVGTPCVGRTQAKWDEVVGMFVNTLAIRNYPDDKKYFKEFLIEVRSNFLDDIQNQAYQFDDLIDKLQVKRDGNRNPLFDTMFSCDFEERSGGSSSFSGDHQRGTSKFDLSLSVIDYGTGIEINLEYATSLYKESTINNISQHFINLLEDACTRPEAKISDLNIMSDDERNQLIGLSTNYIRHEYSNKTIHALFEEQANKRPQEAALVYKGEKWSYLKLNEKANCLARLLRAKGVDKDYLVGIMIDRSPYMIVGLLAILKSGGAYVPIDPDYPHDRVNYMLNDSNCKLLLSKPDLTEQLNYSGTIISLEDPETYKFSSTNLGTLSEPSDLAYIIYTSGSTGKPKGVMTEHRNVTNYIGALTQQIKITPDDVMLQQASFSFDTFTEELYTTLLAGASLVIPDKEEILDIEKLSKRISENNVSVISCSPLLLNALNGTQLPESVRICISGGDVLKKAYVNNILSKGVSIYNTYGPTESTVCATLHECKESDKENIPIGKPLAGYGLLILDGNRKIVPVGIPGELCVAGEGLARGYLGRNELTAEKFIDNPFGSGKIYLTGDICKMNYEGDIEYLGRIDQQVKIRGYRIETGEIENCLKNHEDIDEVVVMALADDDDKYLCAYYVSKKSFDIGFLKSYLAESLPEYMIPSFFMNIESVPQTHNGKIDKKRLPTPLGKIVTGVKYVAPHTNVEKQLAKIYEDILGIESPGVNDSFFDLGGQSLKATKLVMKTKLQFKAEISLVDIFTKPTIKELAEKIENRSLQTNESSSYIAPLNLATDPDRKLFFVHDGSGDIQGYAALATLLTTYDSYGIRCHLLDKFGPEKIEIRTLAKQYIEELKIVQPEPPYNLIGWSLGGVIAYEMAAMLEHEGCKIESLILVDTQLTLGEGRIGQDAFSLNNEKDLLASRVLDADHEYLQKATTSEELWKNAATYFDENKIGVNDIKAMLPESVYDLIPHFDKMNITNIVKHINTVRSLDHICFENPVAFLKAPISYIKARESNLETNVLKEFFKKEVYFTEIEGTHFTIFQQPKVNTLSEEIANILLVK